MAIDFSAQSITFSSAEGGSSGMNTWERYHLMPLNTIMVNPPSLKSQFLDLPNDDGSVDMTYQDSRLKFGLREGEWTFKLYPTYSLNIFRQIANELHGGRFKVVPQNDSALYEYYGRITVNDWKSESNGNYITLGYQLDPYKIDPGTAIDQYVNIVGGGASSWGSTVKITVPTTKMPVVPYINVINGEYDEIVHMTDEFSGKVRVSYTSAGIDEQKDLDYADFNNPYPSSIPWVPIRLDSGTSIYLNSYNRTTDIKFRYKGSGTVNARVRYKGGWI